MPAPRKPAAAFAGVDDVREQLARLREQVSRTLAAIAAEEARPVPLAEVERRIEATMAGLRAEAERLDAGGVLASPEGGRLAQDLAASRLPPFALAAVLEPGQLAAWLRERAVVAASTMGEAVDAATRAGRIAKLRGELAALERREAELLWQAEGAGVELAWRGDLDPAAVLGLDA